MQLYWFIIHIYNSIVSKFTLPELKVELCASLPARASLIKQIENWRSKHSSTLLRADNSNCVVHSVQRVLLKKMKLFWCCVTFEFQIWLAKAWTIFCRMNWARCAVLLMTPITSCPRSGSVLNCQLSWADSVEYMGTRSGITTVRTVYPQHSDYTHNSSYCVPTE